MFRIIIGPFTTEIRISPKTKEQEIKNIFNGFITDKKPSIVISARLIDDLVIDNYEGPAPATMISDSFYNIKWHYFYGTFDLKNGIVEAKLNSRPYVLSSIMRIIYTLKATYSNGLIIHSASFIKDGEAYLFPAKSGTGKSTLTRITSQTDRSISILSDEISYISYERGKVIAYSTPFWGNTKIKGTYLKAPLKKIYFLKQSSKDYKRRLSFKDSIKQMMENVLYATMDFESLDNTLLTIQKILPKTDNNILYFTKSPRFLEVI